MDYKLIEDRFEAEVEKCKDCSTYLFCVKHQREWDRMSKMSGGPNCAKSNTATITD